MKLQSSTPQFIDCANLPDANGVAGTHRVAYYDWGDARNPNVIVCAHGVSRSGLDFQTLAAHLSDQYRVISIDAPGRGQSDWLANPAHYALPQYVSDVVMLLKSLRSTGGAKAIHWLGTSMGGLIGMLVAGLQANPAQQAIHQGQRLIDSLIVNDVGPHIDAQAVARIGNYLGQPIRFETFEQAQQYIQTISAPFGHHSPAQWAHLTENAVKPDEQGGFKLHYDPAIAVNFKAITPEIAAQGEQVLWQTWGSIDCPTLLMRGALSDLLSSQTAQRMQEGKPNVQFVELPNVGHATMFQHDEHIKVVSDYLQFLQGR